MNHGISTEVQILPYGSLQLDQISGSEDILTPWD